MEDEIFIPVLHSFENGNTFSGSCGAMRFFLRPQLAAEGRERFWQSCGMDPFVMRRARLKRDRSSR